MNPLLSEALGSILRWLLAGAAGWLVQHGIWTQAQSQTYIMAAALAVLSLGWSLWQKYKSRLKFLTALESPAGTSEDAVKFKVADGRGAALTVLCLAAVLGSGLLTLGCASQARLHPNLSPVGQVVAHVNTVDDATILVQHKVEAWADMYCGANRTPSCQAAQIAAPVMRTAKAIGAASQAVGDAFSTYLAAKDAVGQASAKQALFDKIAVLEKAGTDLTAQAFTVIKADVEAVSRDIATLKTSATKGL